MFGSFAEKACRNTALSSNLFSHDRSQSSCAWVSPEISLVNSLPKYHRKFARGKSKILIWQTHLSIDVINHFNIIKITYNFEIRRRKGLF